MSTLCFLAVTTVQFTMGCVNIEGVTVEGSYQIVEGESHVDLLIDRMNADPSVKLANLAGGPEDHYKFELRSLSRSADDEKAALRDIFTGKYEAAIGKLLALEEKEPGRYSTAANLGTAYELAGDNTNALKWITEGIARNEHSHYGTEWLHKKILETKIQLGKNPGHLQTNHILAFKDEDHRNTAFTYEYDGRTLSTEAILDALHYQLSERMLFVKPEDPVVADLLYSFAILEANTRILEPAIELLKLARDYGYHDTVELNERLARYETTVNSTWKVNFRTFRRIVPGVILLLVIFGSVFLVLRGLHNTRHERQSSAQS